jgi:glycosyltransferase involved in cell wall biosynthesis
VSFYGRYEPERLLSILDGAAALLVPSRVRESFGRTANLALQAGIPVIAARHGALPEFVHDGTNGSLFEAGNSASLAESMRTILESGLDMQAEMDSWPAVPSLEEHTSKLIGLYGASP